MATRFTMEQPFYIERLQDRGLTPVIPFADDRDTIHRVIYDELCQGAITPESEAKYVAIADRLADQGGLPHFRMHRGRPFVEREQCFCSGV